MQIQIDLPSYLFRFQAMLPRVISPISPTSSTHSSDAISPSINVAESYQKIDRFELFCNYNRKLSRRSEPVPGIGMLMLLKSLL
ncbi:hypothetical protein LINPERHAP1_LOCUS3362 [Linum perenne]